MEVNTELEDIDAQPSTNSAGSSSNSRLGLCEVCATHEAKYTCPRCEVKTCSLKCNKIHKLELECNGERDRTKFVPLNKFSNLDLSSDYRLLEEIGRNLEASRKSFGKRYETIPGFLIKLQRVASTRKTRLKFLPSKFARHKSNSTRIKGNVIHWHIDFIFNNAEHLKLTDKNIPETERISTIVDKYFNLDNENPLSERLQYYKAAGASGVSLFLKAEQKAGKKFYELDPSLSLKEVLAKKLIIEYPTIHVVLKDHASGYDVIDSDDEEEKMDVENRTKSGREVVEDIVKKGENDDSLYRSLKNLLFISEYSDEDISEEE